jgi:YbbR domain-containing protein
MRLPFPIDVSRAAFAVALSILLYFVALNETNPESRQETGFAIPVQVVNVPAGLVVTDQPPDVRVWVRAPSNVFGRLSRNSFTAQVDCTSAQAGQNDNLPITVTPTDPEVREAIADPPTATLTLEEVRPQDLPVRVNVIGSPPAGYQRGEPTVDPAHITVTGAASLVSRASEAVVDVSVDRLTVSVNGVYTPRIVDDRGNDLRDLNLRANPPSVTVQVPITQQTQYKEVGIRAVTEGEPAPGYLLQPLVVNPPTATLRGNSQDLEGANFISTAPIDVTGISTTTVRTVALIPPQGTLLLQPGQTVTVTISVTTLTVTQTVRVPPSITNLPANVQVAKAPGPVSVTISGPAPALSTLALNPNDFRVTLDLSGKGPGSYDIDAKVQRVPSGLTLENIDPPKVHVDLQAAPTPVPPTPVPSATPTS